MFEKYQYLWLALFWLLLACLNGVTNSLSVIDDFARRQIEIASWQPILWEFSSQLAILVLIPMLVVLDRRYPITLTQWKTDFVRHLLFSLLFSLLHVLLMVAMRKLGYWFGDDHYNFATNFTNRLAEWGYEYRKDLQTYASIISTFYIYRFIISRLRSEAALIDAGEDQPQPTYVERFIVKKLGKEFIIKAADIEWVEASGNYMNLHLGERCYPLRQTLAGLTTKLDPHQFARIHRSYLVNIAQIDQIAPLPSGDFQLRLKNGKILSLSRRYRDAVKGVI